MSYDSVGFSEEYGKLSSKFFPTIRRYDRYPSEGSKIRVKKSNGEEFIARILWKLNMELKKIPTSFLLFDTDKETREEALRKIQSFYRTEVAEDEKFTVLFLKKSGGSD